MAKRVRSRNRSVRRKTMRRKTTLKPKRNHLRKKVRRNRKSTMNGGYLATAKTKKPKDILTRVQTLEKQLIGVAGDLQITRVATDRLKGEFTTVKKAVKQAAQAQKDMVKLIKK